MTSVFSAWPPPSDTIYRHPTPHHPPTTTHYHNHQSPSTTNTIYRCHRCANMFCSSRCSCSRCSRSSCSCCPCSSSQSIHRLPSSLFGAKADSHRMVVVVVVIRPEASLENPWVSISEGSSPSNCRAVSLLVILASGEAVWWMGCCNPL